MRIDAKLHADNVQLAAKLGASVQIGGGKGGVQSDWAQNDAAAADYVRNRPGGYYGDPVETEVEVFSGLPSSSGIYTASRSTESRKSILLLRMKSMGYPA